MEITSEQNKVVDAKTKSNDAFHAIFERMGDPNLLLREGRFIDCNLATLKLLGYPSKAEFLNKRPSDISPAYQSDGQSSEDQSARMISLALQNGFHRFDWDHSCFDGSTVTVEVMLTPITLDNEIILHTLWRDITQRKQLEANLTRQVEMLKILNDIVAISGLQPRETLREALRIGLKYLKLDFGIVSQIRGSDYEVVVQVSPPDTMSDGLHFVTENTYCNETLKLGDVLAIPNVPLSEFSNHPCYRDFGLASYIGAPVWVSGTKFGTINFSSPTALAREFGPDIDFVRLLARWAGAFIERMQFEEELALASSIYKNSSEGMLIANSENNIVAVNPAFEWITGYSASALVGNNPRMLSSGKHDREFYECMWKSITEKGSWQGEIWNRHKNGNEYLENLRINTIYGEDGHVRRRIALISDITDKKRSEELIWHQANFDTLTSLPNRRLFLDRMSQEIKLSKRTGLPFALLFIDLDSFKAINDTLGHDMGDVLLIETAQRISSCVRESDTVARLAGDEFTVILTSLEDPSKVNQIAQSIVEMLRTPFTLGVTETFVSASVGITLYPEAGNDVDSLIKSADQAMYAAKRAGKGQYASACKSNSV
jgi:diguanylate cyclase (GGDEF)-like protein/PAS domain S-box-containing protein